MRLIDADALKYQATGGLTSVGLLTLAEIDDAPTIDAVPVVHGRWVNYRKAVIGLATIWSAECSECGCGQVRKFEEYNYCPNCGAKMIK